MIARTLIVLCLLGGSAVLSAHLTSSEVAVDRAPLADLPLDLGEWQGRQARPFPDDIVSQLGVDDYVNRHYVDAAQVPLVALPGCSVGAEEVPTRPSSAAASANSAAR